MVERRMEQRIIVLNNQEDAEKVLAFMKQEGIKPSKMSAERAYWGVEAEYQLADVGRVDQFKNPKGEALTQEEFEVLADRLADLFYEDSEFILDGDTLTAFVKDKIAELMDTYSEAYLFEQEASNSMKMLDREQAVKFK